MENMKQDNRKRRMKKRLLLAMAGGSAALVLCLILFLVLMDRDVMLRSDSAGVEFVTKGEFLTEVQIDSRSPYRSIVPGMEEEIVRDAEGNITEVTRTYTAAAEFSWHMHGNMKINIEKSDTVLYTYLLKFSDKDITVVNGKVVE